MIEFRYSILSERKNDYFYYNLFKRLRSWMINMPVDLYSVKKCHIAKKMWRMHTFFIMELFLIRSCIRTEKKEKKIVRIHLWFKFSGAWRPIIIDIYRQFFSTIVMICRPTYSRKKIRLSCLLWAKNESTYIYWAKNYICLSLSPTRWSTCI